ncbi:MAG TPA: flagellin [Opitutaceae bacterium]|jgi:flagellar hook-associated protein 3 FlgL|nr:flagellin [Opitutaceae bacterium]
MRIASSTLSEGIVNQIDTLSTQQATLQNEVSTGQKISEPEDNPSGVNTALTLESELRAIQQFGSNASQALTVAQSSSAGLTSLKSVSDRAGELATLGTGTLGTSAMQSYGTETNQLIEQAVQTANTEFDGSYIYGGTASSTPPFTVTRDSTGNITSVAYAGNTSQAAIPLSSTTSVSATTDGTTNQGIATFLNNLITLRNSLNSGDTAAVTSVQSGLADGEDTIVSAIATNGGIQSRIQAAQTEQTSQTTNLQTDMSSVVDADLPTTITKLDQVQTAYQAALQSAVSTMQLSILNYIH